MGTPPTNMTTLLRDAAGGSEAAARRLFAQVFDELRVIARRRMAGERCDHTLQATALVNEAWLKMRAGARPGWNNRAHFFFAAAEAMRRILIDHARRHKAIRRGSGRPAITGVLDLASEENISDALALDELILRLEKEDAQVGQIVRLRFYAGLSVEQTAAALEISPRTVKRDWSYARAWLADAWRGEEAT